MDVGGQPYAIKCFTKSSQDIQRRYYEISRYLKEIQGKYNIEALKNFQYLNQCVRTMKDPTFFYPVLKMDWIEGSVLNSFIAANLKKQPVLKNLAQLFLETSAKLHRLGVSHGDLAGDNIIVTPKDSIALIDYDGMYVPAFRGEKAPEKGHEHFQHPDRSINHFSEDLDNFSSLIIYTSLLAVSSKPELWNRYNKGDYDCLVFRHNDFKDPGSSPLIGELTKQNGTVGKLSNLVYKAIDHEPLWDQISPERILKI
jgi:serine/threonine protein kinase